MEKNHTTIILAKTIDFLRKNVQKWPYFLEIIPPKYSLWIKKKKKRCWISVTADYKSLKAPSPKQYFITILFINVKKPAFGKVEDRKPENLQFCNKSPLPDPLTEIFFNFSALRFDREEKSKHTSIKVFLMRIFYLQNLIFTILSGENQILHYLWNF